MDSRNLTAEDALGLAAAQRDELARDIDVADRAIADLAAHREKLVQEHRQLVAHVDWLGKLLTASAEDVSGAPQGRKAAEGQTPSAVIRSKAIAFVRSRNKPSPIADIFAALEAEGIVILGASPSGNLSSKLSQAPGNPLVYLPKHGWWPRELPWPDARYYPKSADNGEVVAAPIKHSARKHRSRGKTKRPRAPSRNSTPVSDGFYKFATDLLKAVGQQTTAAIREHAIAAGGLGIDEATDLRSLGVRLMRLTKQKVVVSHGSGRWGPNLSTAARAAETDPANPARLFQAAERS